MDGTEDRRSANRFEVESYPTFVAIEPGSRGDSWVDWDPQHRDYASMKKWLTKQLKKHDMKPQPAVIDASAAEKLQQNYHLGMDLPLVDAQPSAAMFKMQMDENKKMQEMI